MGVFDKFKDLVCIKEIDDDEEITEEEIRSADNKMERKKIEPRSNIIEVGKIGVLWEIETTPLLVIIEPAGFKSVPDWWILSRQESRLSSI